MRKRSNSLSKTKLLHRNFADNFMHAVVGLACLVLILLDSSGSSVTKMIRLTIADITTPVVHAIGAPVRITQNLVHNVSNLAYLQSNNAALTNEVTKLNHWRDEVYKLRAENAELRKLLKLNPDPAARYVTARVIAMMGGPFVNSALVSVGQDQSVKVNYVAQTGKGLIGRVTEVGQKSSRLLLITDINSKVPVYVGRSRIKAILSGNNDQPPRLRYAAEGVKIGDRVVTSGDGGIFPSNLPVGIVSKVDGKSIYIKTFADFHRLDFVRLVDYGLQDFTF